VTVHGAEGAAAFRVKELAADQLRAIPGVLSVKVGWKEVGGMTTTLACIVVVVARKHPRHELVTDDVIPAAIDGIPTDVVERSG
jgi:orotate phosphoribosyltransferase-like protein